MRGIRSKTRRFRDKIAAADRQHATQRARRNEYDWKDDMAKGQKRSNREIRKPKAEKPKTNASQPSQKFGAVKGLENMRNK